MDNITSVTFRFTWPDGGETSIKVRLNKANVAIVTMVVGDPARLPNFDSYRNLSAMRAEALLFSAKQGCSLTVQPQ